MFRCQDFRVLPFSARVNVKYALAYCINHACMALVCVQANLISWYGPLYHRKEDGLITCHTFHAITQASYNDLPGSIQVQVIWNLWYTDAELVRVFSEYLCSHCQYSLTPTAPCSIIVLSSLLVQ